MDPVAPALSAPETPRETQPEPRPGAAATDPARALIEEQMAMLSRLARIGMEVAEACGRAATDTAPDADPKAAGLVFARVARAVRMTIALQSRLAGELAVLDRADKRAEASAKDARRIRLSRLVNQAARAGVEAKRDAGTRRWSDEDAIEDEIDRLAHDAYERLTDAEDGHIWTGSFDEVVAAVCKDLGVTPDWTARLAAAVTPPPGSRPDSTAPAERPPTHAEAPPGTRPPAPSGPGWDTLVEVEDAGAVRLCAAAPLRPG